MMARYSSQFPDPVTLVTAATKGRTNVMAVGWTSPVSLEPPILMVSIAPQRFTHDMIMEAGEFAVCVLADDQKILSEIAGTLSGRDENKLALQEFRTTEAELIRAPLISGARASFECQLVSTETVGDHTVFYGEVLRTVVDESKSPLVLFNRIYYALGERKGDYP
jgi:flavin reductase (DIM6/NTAB) family NADH-FMN oxidoreductase RutF